MMEFAIKILQICETTSAVPRLFGWYHIAWLIGIAVVTILLCFRMPKPTDQQVRRLVGWTSLAVLVLEVYKQIINTFSPDGAGIAADYQWYTFPFQFCSTPMYVGALAGILGRGRVYDACCAYLATFSLFAGACVMIYPAQAFSNYVGLNIQTMICHGSMVVIGVYLLYTQYVRATWRTLLRATALFAAMLAMAVGMNEIAYRTGLTAHETFNMFFVSPYCEPSLPVYSSVQQAVAYPWCMFLYMAAFTLAAAVILGMAQAGHRMADRIRCRV